MCGPYPCILEVFNSNIITCHFSQGELLLCIDYVDWVLREQFTDWASLSYLLCQIAREPVRGFVAVRCPGYTDHLRLLSNSLKTIWTITCPIGTERTGAAGTCWAATGSLFLEPPVNNDSRFEKRFSHRKTMMDTMCLSSQGPFSGMYVNIFVSHPGFLCWPPILLGNNVSF